jgi:hypothetical protein
MDVQYYLNIINSGFVYQIDIPNIFLLTPEIIHSIQTKNWIVLPSKIPGWTTIIKQQSFYS